MGASPAAPTSAAHDEATMQIIKRLHEIPREDMLVDPDELEARLEEPSEEDRVSSRTLLLWSIATIAVTVVSGIWWAAAGH